MSIPDSKNRIEWEITMDIRIYPILMGLDTIYAIRGEGVILIDGGDPHSVAKFKKGIEKASIEPQEAQLILLTHGHWDHIGSVRDIKELTGAKVLLHEGDMHLLEDTHPSQPPGLTVWGKIITALVKLYLPFLRIPMPSLLRLFQMHSVVCWKSSLSNR